MSSRMQSPCQLTASECRKQSHCRALRATHIRDRLAVFRPLQHRCQQLLAVEVRLLDRANKSNLCSLRIRAMAAHGKIISRDESLTLCVKRGCCGDALTNRCRVYSHREIHQRHDSPAAGLCRAAGIPLATQRLAAGYLCLTSTRPRWRALRKGPSRSTIPSKCDRSGSACRTSFTMQSVRPERSVRVVSSSQ